MTTTPPVFGHLATLGDTTRSRLLALLEEREFTVTELRRILQLPQSTVSGHLKVLADGGWATSRADGKNRFYRMDPGLDGESRALWALVREEMENAGFQKEDRERARSVLGDRVDRSRAFFSESAERWEEVRSGLYGTGVSTLPLFGLLEPEQVLADLGCGTGQLAAAASPFVRRVVGVDRSPAMLRAARRRFGDEAAAVELRQGDLESLPVDDGEADVAVLSLVLHLVVDPATVLEEAFRILSAGGRLILVDMRAHDRLEYRETMGHVWPGFDAGQIRRWLEGAGFEATRVLPLPPDAEADGPLLFLATGRRGATGGGPG